MSINNNQTTISPNSKVASERYKTDRRRSHWNLISLFHSITKRRRRSARRDTELNRGYYVDVYDPKLALMAIVIMALSCLDAFFTLIIINHGGEEVNYFMKVLLETNVNLFLGVKFAITGFSIFITLVHSHFKFFNLVRCYNFLGIYLIIYLALIQYEIVLLSNILF